MFSSVCKNAADSDSERYFTHSEPMFLLQTKPPERIENNFQTIANDRMLLYPSHYSGIGDSLPTKDSDTELFAFDISDSFLQYQSPYYAEQTNFNVNCCDSTVENAELQLKNVQEESVSLSSVGRCIRTACDILLGIDPCDNDNLLGSIYSQLKGAISTEFNFSTSHEDASLLKANILYGCEDYQSENNCENRESENKLLKYDDIPSLSMRYNFSETFTEDETTDSEFMSLISSDSKQQASFSGADQLDGNVQKNTEIKREKLETEKYQFKHDFRLSRSLRYKSSETPNEERNDTKPKQSGEKLLQCDGCQRIFPLQDNLDRHLSTQSG
ncbi:hypothetical protein NPIL_277511 [Nephila pilipes]|uniref:C2H2-type domain-containing protein n=1 Tax=Nephila pilipes TaxID=299642 RepID=A0A8X6URY4_NEPPI|nr:hypothetical protein NPIL_277511 [Nephila pilipes]